MLPHIRIPSHITALYVFAVLNWLIMFHITLVDAHVNVLNRVNQTIEEILDMPASFGSPIPKKGVYGGLMIAVPITACEPLRSSLNISVRRLQIVLIRRGNCSFGQKVLHAQQAGHPAAIVYNDDGDELLPMSGGEYGDMVHIPSAFIGHADAIYLEEIFELDGKHILLDDRAPLSPTIYLLPFAVVVGVCFVLMLAFMIIKWVRDLRRQRRNRLSKRNLKKIPIKKFKKGDEYDVCAICLDDYEEGDKMRILPCSHAYHVKCVDPWLTKNKRTCPVCKRKVMPGDDDSDSDSDSDGGRHSESTPLLGAQHHGNPSIQTGSAGVYGNSGLPQAVRSEQVVAADSDSDDLSHLGAAAVPPSGSHIASVHSYGTNDPAELPVSQETHRADKSKRRTGQDVESSRSQKSDKKKKSRSQARRHSANGHPEEVTVEDEVDHGETAVVVPTSTIRPKKKKSKRRQRGVEGVESSSAPTAGLLPNDAASQELSEAVYLGQDDEEASAAIADDGARAGRYDEDIERGMEVEVTNAKEKKKTEKIRAAAADPDYKNLDV